MNSAIERSKSSWLLAFGDVITLLLTFFIVVVVVNKSDISKIDKWVDDQLNSSFEQLSAEVELKELKLLSVSREPRGIKINIESDRAFEVGSFVPSEELVKELQVLTSVLAELPVLNIGVKPETKTVVERAATDGLEWFSEVAIQGHTDNVWVNPESRLRNNFFLSTLRAEAVMGVMQSQTVLNADLFSITGYGEWQPIAENTSDTGRQQNRRVEVLITASFIPVQL